MFINTIYIRTFFAVLKASSSSLNWIFNVKMQYRHVFWINCLFLFFLKQLLIKTVYNMQFISILLLISYTSLVVSNDLNNMKHEKNTGNQLIIFIYYQPTLLPFVDDIMCTVMKSHINRWLKHVLTV